MILYQLLQASNELNKHSILASFQSECDGIDDTRKEHILETVLNLIAFSTSETAVAYAFEYLKVNYAHENGSQTFYLVSEQQRLVEAGSLNAILLFTANYKGHKLLDDAFYLMNISLIDGKYLTHPASLLDEEHVTRILNRINHALLHTIDPTKVFSIMIELSLKACSSSYFADKFFNEIDQDRLQQILCLVDNSIKKQFIILITDMLVTKSRRDFIQPVFARALIKLFLENSRGEAAKLWLNLFVHLVKEGFRIIKI
jgi:hypothetical protein